MILNKITTEIILTIDETNDYISKVNKKINGSISYVTKIIKDLIGFGFIEYCETESHKRIKKLRLSKIGEELKNNLQIIKNADSNITTEQ